MGLRKKCIGIVLIVLVLCSCQIEKDIKKETKEIKENIQETEYRSEFTKEEKEKGYAEFELMENVIVNAEITPVSKYKNGLAKYYMQGFYETTNLEKTEDFAKNPSVYRKKLSKVMDILSNKIGGTFKNNKINIEFLGTSVKMHNTFTGKNGYGYDFFTFWFTGGETVELPEQIYSPSMRIELNDGINKSMDNNIDYYIERYVTDYDKTELTFLDKKEEAEELKQFLEGLIGRKLNDSYKCIPVSKENVRKLNNIMQELNYDSYEEPEEEYYAFWFYYDVANFPLKDLNLNYQLKEGESYDKSLANTVINGNTLIGLSNDIQYVIVSEKGILNLRTLNIRMESDIYKEAENIVDPNEILQKIKQYYERQMVLKQVNITEIQLVYTGYFTDAIDDPVIKPTIAPFWLVTAYDQSTSGNVKFIYDAFTGDCIQEAVWK